ALVDDLEQQVGAMLVDGEVAELIDDQHGGLEVTAELVLEAAGRLRGRQRVDDVDGGGEEHGVSTNAGGMAKRNGDVRLAEADGADEDDVGLTFNEGQPEQVLDLRAVDLLGPAPLKILERLEHGEARVFDAPLDGAVLAQGGFAFDELCGMIDVL